jgi:glutaredoxin 2
MQLSLYHYVHCPFCLRVRMTLGLLGLNYSSIVLPYQDEKTPQQLSGSKMLPILVKDGQAMNESLDIMQELDQNNILRIKQQVASSGFKEFEAYLNYLGGPIHSLAMPYWVYTPEFDPASRAYFQQKKEAKRGPFKLLVQQRDQYIGQLMEEFPRISAHLKPFYDSSTLGLQDILLASHLWGLYVVPEFQFPEAIHQWLQQVKKECNFDYHKDFWV